MAVDDFEEVKDKLPPASWRLWAVVHALLSFPTVIAGFAVVPRIEAILLDFGLPLPTYTKWTIAATHGLVKWFPYALVLFGVAAKLDVSVLLRLADDRLHPERVTTWGVFWTLVLLLLIVTAAISLVLPLLTILMKLSD